MNSNAKIWGQRLSDGTYATIYNPAEYRWPLAISLSRDDWRYTTLNLVYGDVPAMRYAGNYKSFGPQYARGIQEATAQPPDGDLVGELQRRQGGHVGHPYPRSGADSGGFTR